MVSSNSARNVLLTPSSINTLVTDREIFTLAASVVPKLRSVLEHRKDMLRSSSVWHAPSSRRKQQLPCWVINRKLYGVEICEFDRAKLPQIKNIDSSNWFRGSSRVADIRHSMIESRESGSTCDALLGGHTQSENRTQELLQWPSSDLDISYAVSAHVTLNCQLNEAMTMLFSRETLQFDASMSALFGARKYRNGDLLISREFHKNRSMEYDNNSMFCVDDEDLNDLSQPGWIALHSVVLRPRRSLNPITAATRTSRRQRLCFAAYSQLCPDSNEAFYTMKTLPKPMHDKLTGCRDQRASEQVIRGNLDHIAVGYHLRSTYSDLSGHQTRIVMTAYVHSPQISDKSQTRSKFWVKGNPSNGDPVTCQRHCKRSKANAEAKYVVNLLATATTTFEQLVRRRRLGNQPFFQTPVNRNTAEDTKCSVCLKHFGLMRYQRFCQLCAKGVCRECSRKVEVEPFARKVRRNRVCFACVASVDASVFKQENPLLHASFSKISVGEGKTNKHDQERDAADVNPSTASYDASLNYTDCSRNSLTAQQTLISQASIEAQLHRPDRSSSAVTTSTSFSSTSGRQLADALFSKNPRTRARALETVRQILKQVTSESTSACTSSTFKSPMSLSPSHNPDEKMMDKYIEARLHLSNITVSEDTAFENRSEDISRIRSNYYHDIQFGTQRRRCYTSGQCFPSSTFNENSIAPRPWTTTTNLETELDLDDGLDSAALDSICEVAAVRMQCSIAYIVAFNGAHSSQAQRIVGCYGAPSQFAEKYMAICPLSLIKSGKPFVIKDPACDPQLSNPRLVRNVDVQLFAGFPIKSPDGTVVACLCLMNTTRCEKIPLENLTAMHVLSKLASDLFEEEVNPYTPRH
ncbi:conserved hypothetical protein [Plasmopara halstedii]|uniref:FYVE-type domain-containing protein n=1 Tax=Plasmopara halstedii TaxID=4781 RepID=A0A0P1ASZ3_PLAHL|nr:conserved hypothetical protein [Plasmopara halstedii]CEG44471.1 conserved hypothetical protein [Plasmopara halstedii]|eukprot:XP_024580840.1 conserved hypothetical protein [Plasmopara halstedii]